MLVCAKILDQKHTPVRKTGVHDHRHTGSAEIFIASHAKSKGHAHAADFGVIDNAKKTGLIVSIQSFFVSRRNSDSLCFTVMFTSFLITLYASFINLIDCDPFSKVKKLFKSVLVVVSVLGHFFFQILNFQQFE